MIYIIQLVYIRPGAEDIFEEFESHAIPIIPRYNGRLLLRIRPSENEIIEAGMEVPYEIHFVEFDSEADFENFRKDKEREKYLHLKEQSIRSVLLYKGVSL